MTLTFGGAITQIDNFKNNIFYIKHLQKMGYKITVFDGPNLCKWNGGRTNIEIYLTPEILQYYNDLNIGVNLTFTNNIIDVNDKIGNDLLEMISNNPLNGVILQDEGLRKHIKELYPDMPLTFSFTADAECTEDYLKIEKDYDFLVPRIHLFFDPDFYNRVDLKKYELWVDEQCIHCEKIFYHYNQINELNRKYNNPYKEKGDDFCKAWNDCILPDYNRSNTVGIRYFNKETFKRLRDIGYENFKIPGRDFEPERFNQIIKDVYDFLK